MGRPSYIAANLAEDAVITMSNADTVYPSEYAVDRNYEAPVGWSTDGSNWIEFDLTASLDCSALFWGNHNQPQSGFTFTVKGGASANPSTVLHSPSWTEKGILASWTQAAYRYIRVEFSSTQPTLYPKPQTGEIVIGERVVLPRGVRFGERPHILQAGVFDRTNRGKRYPLELHRLERREYTFRYTESEKANFLTWWKALEGSLYPFVWVPVDGGAEALYMSIEEPGFLPNELPEQAPEPVYEHKLALIEEGLGGAILR